MDYDKLIESLEMHRVIYKNDYDNFSGGACTSDCMDAALAIETLLGENKKLRAGKNKAIAALSKIVKLAHEQRDTAIADLARMTAERDGYKIYYNDLSSKPDCNTCEKRDCEYRPRVGCTVRANCPLYSGPEKEG